jgi:hypothetical protein
MGGAASLQQDSSINSAAVLPQTCAQLLEYVAGARAVYDVQIKVIGSQQLIRMRCVIWGVGYAGITEGRACCGMRGSCEQGHATSV